MMWVCGYALVKKLLIVFYNWTIHTFFLGLFFYRKITYNLEKVTNIFFIWLEGKGFFSPNNILVKRLYRMIMINLESCLCKLAKGMDVISCTKLKNTNSSYKHRQANNESCPIVLTANEALSLQNSSVDF